MIDKILQIFKSSTDYFNFGTFLDFEGEKKQVKYHKHPFIEIKDKLHLHFKGKGIVGLIPILDNIYSFYGVIDIDEYKDIDILELFDIVNKHGGFIFKSKSGGIHAYFFSEYKVESFVMREFLSKISKEIKYNHEIFPKQDYVNGNYGSSINLPFFNFQNSYFDGESWVGFSAFEKDYKTVDIVKKLKKSKEIELKNSDMPHCLQYLLNNLHVGIEHNTLVTLCVYIRLRYSEDLDSVFTEYYNKYFSATEYSFDRAKRTFDSIIDSNVFYQCNAFLKEYCGGKAQCRTQTPYGIANKQNDIDFDVEKITQYKISSDESYFKMIVSGREINFETLPDFWSYKKFRLKAIEQVVGFHPPKIAQEMWEDVLKEVLDNREIIELDESSEYNEFKQEFISWIDSNCHSNDSNDFNLSGGFCNIEKEKIYFNFLKFKQFIKKKKILKDKLLPKLKQDLFDDLNIKNTTIDLEYKKINVKALDFSAVGFFVEKEEF